ncbi:MAG: MerR family transcriptional regulator [Rhodobacterales bacterium]|nr:MAG: MerR family transcriptional regulator [Rhodobacterales bacterium]
MSDDTLSFKEMCAKFDVTPRTLRYYEYIELLSPRREGRSRFYSSRDQARMVLILRGRRWGFSLEEIRQWLELYEQRGSRVQMETLVEHASNKLEELESQKNQLEETITELRGLRDEVARDLKA